MDAHRSPHEPRLPSEENPQSRDTLVLMLRVLAALVLVVGIGSYFAEEGDSEVAALTYLLLAVLFFAGCLGASFVIKRGRR